MRLRDLDMSITVPVSHEVLAQVGLHDLALYVMYSLKVMLIIVTPERKLRPGVDIDLHDHPGGGKCDLIIEVLWSEAVQPEVG